VDVTDQPQQIVDMKDFMAYSDYLNVNKSVTVPLNLSVIVDAVGPIAGPEATQALETVREVAVEAAEITEEVIANITEVIS